MPAHVAVSVPQIAENYAPALRHLILGTMRSWLNGEPVWSHNRILELWGADFEMYRRQWDRGVLSMPGGRGRTIALYELRDEVLKEFGFALPCKELLDVLEDNQPIVEIGAGTGYMTALMRHRGIDVIGTDPGFNAYGFITGRYDVRQMRIQGKTAVRRFRDRTVFCSWATLAETWLRQALRAMEIGRKFISIEEDACAEETTWDYRDASFDHVNWIDLPAWNYMNDRAGLWIKKRHRQPPPFRYGEDDN